MMNFNMLTFLGLRFSNIFIYRIFQYKQKYQQVKCFNTINKLQFYTTLALMWSVKKASSYTTDDKRKNILDEADSLFVNGHYTQCYELLSNYEDSHVEVQWRLSRLLYNMAKELKISEIEKKEMILKGFSIVSGQLDSHWDNYAVHKYYALLLDAKSTLGGMTEKINQLENVKKHMDLAVTLNPNDATTLHMLGEWCFQITELPWYQRKIAETLFGKPPTSTYEDALEYFLRAETAEPRFYSVNLLRIGMCYAKLKKDDQAKYYLKLAASYPAKSNDDHRANRDASTLLKKM